MLTKVKYKELAIFMPDSTELNNGIALLILQIYGYYSILTAANALSFIS